MVRHKSTTDYDSFNKAHKITGEVFANISEMTRRKTAKALGPHALSKTGTLPPKHIAETAADAANRLLVAQPNHPHLDALSLIGVIPSALNALPHTKNSRQARQVMVGYNKVLKGVIERNPKSTLNDVMNMVIATTYQYNRHGQEVVNLKEETYGRLQGMRHELALESVLLNLPEGYAYREGTKDDDGNGRDYIVTAPNGKEVYIDVKASEEGAAEAIQKQEAYYDSIGQSVPRNHIIAASGFEDSDFMPKSPWRPTFEATEELVPGWQELIDDAAGMPPADTPVTILQ